jgi:hypothetical protein
MLGAIDHQKSRREVRIMLEEIMMPPREFLEFMSLTRGSAVTRIQGYAVGTDLQDKFGWRMFGIKTLAHNFPGRREAEAQGKDFFSFHASPPGEGRPKLIEAGQFHIKRRSTT